MGELEPAKDFFDDALRIRRKVCIICIGVFSVYMQYNCVYYCDTCYYYFFDDALRIRRKVGVTIIIGVFSVYMQ
jgi:hypothetical protein